MRKRWLFDRLYWLAMPLAIVFLIEPALASNNVGLYRKLSTSGNTVTWERIWVGYLPELENYQMDSDDFVVYSGGGLDSCSGIFPNPQICSGTFSMSTTTASADDPIGLDPIEVTGSSQDFRYVTYTFLIKPDGPIGNGGGSPEWGSGAIANPVSVEPCDVDSFTNITDEVIKQALLSPRTLEAMQAIARASRLTGNEQAGRITVNTRPSGAFAVAWEPLSAFADNIVASCSDISFDLTIGGSDLSSSIFVHTHPGSCGGALVGPSSGDINVVRWFRAGLIIDLNNDKLIQYDENTSEPNESTETGESEPLCGL